ncbi:MAG: Na+/H+ antiporter NhaA [Gammaproteobacteria bacterium]|jgi:NhaA family Na+:H+ antiporter|nr:Na+/H+ antiporter NhaA [Gammaproteobacteria bacterium]MBT4195679.1 Na+/H+ antiporter NhaA [Gammaproteobacteria bacterium]MBT4449181.1 Na+/H+ antiporter NhaA [Gammaproteobacteria bacterium]MBT4859347.1 Na+/H+ antiporter NhaA [Gammaproteobacteria bacterium]MBT6456930.1 Na+/H+ antiporter NhaA [Gammaproteobacteria bacterium]
MSEKTGKEYCAPWERAFNWVLSPVEEFIHRQTTSGILLMLCAIAAITIANSPWSEAYHHLLELTFTIGVSGFQLSKSIHHWINDGLMAIFFFVIGLELKREILVGELADPKQAMMPILAAIGGMVVPVAIYMSINPGGHTFDGWGIPMATDIAFALGTLALLGNRIPKNLLTFLVALAIVDDLGAVVVIALFYTETISIPALSLAAVMLAFLIALNLGGTRRAMPYVLIGIILWIAMLKSGIHATLAGIFLAFTIPMRPKYDPGRFLEKISGMVENIQLAYKHETNIIKNDELRYRVQALEEGVHLVQAPAQILEHKMHLPSAYIIIPIFSLANAGVPIDLSSLGEIITHPVSMGISAGLVLGKLIGIAGFSWLAVKSGLTTLPPGLNFKHIIGVGLMGGIGFTMSIFIAELGFAHSPEDLLMAKTGILFASLLAGISGFLWLYFSTSETNDN